MDTAQSINPTVYSDSSTQQPAPQNQPQPAPAAPTPPSPANPPQPTQPTPQQTPPSTPPVPPQTPPPPASPMTPPPMMPKRSSKLPLIIVGVLLLLILGLGAYIFQNMTKTKEDIPTRVIPTVTPTIAPTATPTPVDESSTSASLNSTRFYSQELGILFDHAKFTTGSGTMQKAVLTQVTGSRVYVYVSGTVPTKGQYVDVLSKVSTDDVIKAANKIIQQDAKFDNCNIQLNADSVYPATYQEGDLICDGPGGGVSYFLTDSNHPTKMLFVSIGQYAIESETGNMTKPWQDTLRFLSTSTSMTSVEN